MAVRSRLRIGGRPLSNSFEVSVIRKWPLKSPDVRSHLRVIDDPFERRPRQMAEARRAFAAASLFSS